MNKQEAIEKLQSEARHHCGEKECYKDGCTKNVELDIAIDIVNQIDEPVKPPEPEKPVVSQFIADWYEDNKDEFEYNVYSLCIKYHENELSGEIKSWFDKTRNNSIQTLVLMHQFGYEVEKEKLYTAKFKASNEYLNLDRSYKELYFVKVSKDIAEKCSRYHFTKEKLIECSVWNNSAFEIKEVEE